MSAVLLLPAVLLFVLCEPAGQTAPVERWLFSHEAVLDGRWWTVLTAHWVHLTPTHLAWDAAAFLVLGTLCDRLGRGRFLTTVFGAAFAISAVLFFALPDDRYAGLSGIDSALFGMLAAATVVRGVRSGNTAVTALSALLVVGFMAKIGYEWVESSALFVRDSGTWPVPLAHLVGFAFGGLVGVVGLPDRTRPAAPAGRLVHT